MVLSWLILCLILLLMICWFDVVCMVDLCAGFACLTEFGWCLLWRCCAEMVGFIFVGCFVSLSGY